jgi:hypothetical protein
MNSDNFDWIRWRNGSAKTLDILCREQDLILNRNKIKDYAVGYCEGESLICRPKVDNIAVMFLKDDIEFWFHLTKKEFLNIFKED